MSTLKTSDFLRALVPTDAAGYLNLRTFRQGASNQFYKMSEPDAMERVRAYVQRERGQQDLYMGVAERRTNENGTKANCSCIRALFIEIDYKDTLEADARAQLERYHMKPSMLVSSGGGLHVYWLLDEPADLAHPETLARVEGAIRMLMLDLDGDPRAIDASRVLRVPGTFNLKYGTPRPVTLERCDVGVRYALEAFAQPAEDDGAESGSREPRALSLGVVDRDRAVELLAETFPPLGAGVHHYTLYLAGWFARSSVPIEDAYDIIGHADGLATKGQPNDRETRAAVRDSYRAIANGERNVRGLPSAPRAVARP